jgi:hypothetical protein
MATSQLDSGRYPVDDTDRLPFEFLIFAIFVIICALLNCYIEERRDYRRSLEQQQRIE